MTIKVLITGGGGPGTVETLRSLKARGDYEIITADAMVASAGVMFASRSYTVPFGADSRFEAALREILQRERPDFIIPLVDEEIPKVHHLVRTEWPNLRVLTPTLEFCELVLDKWTMAKTMSQHGLAVAASWVASDAGAATYPAIVKPRTGRGSRGLAFLDGPADLERYLAASGQPAERFLVQERLHGREFTTSVVVALDGTMLAVVPKEAVEKRGITLIGVTRTMPAIDTLCRAIVATMKPAGPFNVQLILDATGAPRVIEINPRYSTTTALTIAAGLNEVDAVLRHARGMDPGRLTFEPDLMMIRYTDQVYLKEADWHPIDLRVPPA